MLFKLKILWFWLKLFFSINPKSRKSLEVFQANRMKQFTKNTLAKSKYYQKYFNNSKFDWTSVPQISKTEFMSEFNDINTQGIMLKDAMNLALRSENTRDFKSEINGITVGLSTGTSGKRGLFLVSDSERAQWVALIMYRVIKPRLFKKQKISFFLRANSKLYSSVSSRLFEFRYFDIFRPIPELINELNSYQPHILVAPPSLLMDISEAQQKGEIHICPKQIISCAEVLHANDKSIISTTFKLQVSEVYQCMEGFLGASCAFGTMHLNEDFIHVEKEWIDTDKFYPIITDFSRHSQPVVKYKLNDVLQIKKEACKCGSPFLALEKIIGRDDDVLLLEGKRIYPDIIARKIALLTDDFQKYTIAQVGASTLKIGIEGQNFESSKIAFQTTLESLLTDLGVKSTTYILENKIEVIKGNKTRKITNQYYES